MSLRWKNSPLNPKAFLLFHARLFTSLKAIDINNDGLIVSPRFERHRKQVGINIFGDQWKHCMNNKTILPSIANEENHEYLAFV